MNYILMPSLKHRALTKIAVTLWNQDDIKALVSKFSFCHYINIHPLGSQLRRKKWQEIEDKVIEKVPQLPQPEPLKQEILGFIKPIGIQILIWFEYHFDFGLHKIDVQNDLCWTPQGTVDKKKTAKVLIMNVNLDIAKRYKLACIYCLESDIPKLWNEIAESCRKSFYKEDDPRVVMQQELVVLWTYDIKGEMNKLYNMIGRRWQSKCSRPYQYAFEYSAVGGNKAATEYFLQKLTFKERGVSLLRSAGQVVKKRWIFPSDFTYREHYIKKCHPIEQYADVLCCLLSHMDKEQQTEFFKSYPYKVLECLLDWPWQSLFMETVNRMWDFLSKEDYNRLLQIIIYKVQNGYKDCNYQKLFEEMWKQSRDAHKRYVIDQCTTGSLLPDLLMIKDEKNFKLILKNVNLTEKGKLIFCDSGQYICRILIRDNWDLLEFFIRECISSKQEMIKFKEVFEERVRWCGHSKEELLAKKDKWNIFFLILGNCINGYDNKKRFMEQGSSNSVKRLHSAELQEVSPSMKK